MLERADAAQWSPHVQGFKSIQNNAPNYILNINSDGTSVAWVTEKLIKGLQ